LRTATKLLATNKKYNSLFECRLVRVELLRDDVVNERQSSADILSCPVTEVLVKQALISSCNTHTPYQLYTALKTLSYANDEAHNSSATRHLRSEQAAMV